jgi:hypothetical protein
MWGSLIMTMFVAKRLLAAYRLQPWPQKDTVRELLFSFADAGTCSFREGTLREIRGAMQHAVGDSVLTRGGTPKSVVKELPLRFPSMRVEVRQM